jgi:hypothetical protein
MGVFLYSRIASFFHGDTTCTSMGHRGIIILYIYILYVYIHTVDIVIIIHNGYITQNGMKSRSQDGGFNQKRTV